MLTSLTDTPQHPSDRSRLEAFLWLLVWPLRWECWSLACECETGSPREEKSEWAIWKADTEAQAHHQFHNYFQRQKAEAQIYSNHARYSTDFWDLSENFQ